MRAATKFSSSVERRNHWVKEIANVSGHFGNDTGRIERELIEEINSDGLSAILDHLRQCGSIPEGYGHDSSEEKLYSKYTDILLAACYKSVGLTALVLTERADSADVEAANNDFSLVGDAKAFRLSRTAKNQKDFKIEALHSWKRGKPHAMVVCPIYQLPVRTSQIYQQAIARNVCIFSYSHLAVVVRFAAERGGARAQKLLLAILKCAEAMNPSKDSVGYWYNLNKRMLEFDGAISKIWQDEKSIVPKSIKSAKEEALGFLAREREAIMKMTREEAIHHLIQNRNLAGKEAKIRKIGDNGIMTFC